MKAAPALLLLALAGPLSAAEPLRMAVDSGTEMPMARIERDAVVDGMSLELAQLLAKRLNRRLLIKALPRKRLQDALVDNEVDAACAYLPAWLPGPLQWSRPFLLQEYAIVSRRDAPAPTQLQSLRGQTIGTVLGFVYPELEAALGADFRREDAPNAGANLRKLAAGRVSHIAISLRQLGYQRRQDQFRAAIHAPLPVGELRTQCALAPQAGVTLAAFNAAIEAIERDGSLAALYRRYPVATESSTRSSSRP